MLLEEIQELLKALEPDIATIKEFWQGTKREDEFAHLKKESEQELFWKHPQHTQIAKDLQRLNIQRTQYLTI
jgi:hypothetical protein